MKTQSFARWVSQQHAGSFSDGGIEHHGGTYIACSGYSASPPGVSVELSCAAATTLIFLLVVGGLEPKYSRVEASCIHALYMVKFNCTVAYIPFALIVLTYRILNVCLYLYICTHIYIYINNYIYTYIYI